MIKRNKKRELRLKLRAQNRIWVVAYSSEVYAYFRRVVRDLKSGVIQPPTPAPANHEELALVQQVLQQGFSDRLRRLRYPRAGYIPDPFYCLILPPTFGGKFGWTPAPHSPAVVAYQYVRRGWPSSIASEEQKEEEDQRRRVCYQRLVDLCRERKAILLNL